MSAVMKDIGGGFPGGGGGGGGGENAGITYTLKVQYFPDVDGETFHVNVALLQLAVIPLEIEGNHDCIEEKPKKRSTKKK